MTSLLPHLSYPWLNASDTHPVQCCLCRGASPHTSVYSFTINDRPFTIQECLGDGCLYLDPQPGRLWAESLYHHPGYYTGEDDMYGLKVDDTASTAIASIRLDEIKKIHPNATSLLEIGCAKGHTLLEAKRRGFDVVRGAEFSRSAVDACRALGLDVYEATANDALPPMITQSSYDIVASYSVLEHLENPSVFLQSLLPILHRNGLLILRVPRMSRTGPWLSLVDHTWHFTEAVLQRLLEQTGYHVVQMFASGVFHGQQHGGTLESMTVVAQHKQ